MADEITTKKLSAHSALTAVPHTKSWVLRFVDSTWGQVAGVITTLGAGAVVAHDQIHKAAFRIFSGREVGGFKDLQDARDIAIGKAVAKSKAGEAVDVIGEVQKRNRIYSNEIKLRKERLGIRNVFDEWGMLRAHQRKEVLLTVSAATAIALGAVLAIATSRQGEIEREIQEKENKEQKLQL